ncbi:MAG TPA: hypothetical protein VFX43_07295 [Chitinophagaceae bacterium]|nr:hypothetical protein [Chitinophagaceae bacterium]
MMAYPKFTPFQRKFNTFILNPQRVGFPVKVMIAGIADGAAFQLRTVSGDRVNPGVLRIAVETVRLPAIEKAWQGEDLTGKRWVVLP